MRFLSIQRITLALLVMVGVTSTAPVGAAYQEAQAPDIASYQMNVRLDPVTKTVSGTERITYTNPSADTLGELWLRLYLKAFSSTETVWMRESGGQLRGDRMDADELGDISVSKLSLADGTDLLLTTTLSDTLMRVPLPQPLGPGQQVELDVEWTSKLPRVFARTGYGGRDDTFFMVGQWYPKMAVYDRGRWDTEPWHGNAEFFHDFGSYDVSITVPQEYVVAGAGVPAGEQPEADGFKTLRFTSDNVNDYAFAASPDFRVQNAKAGDVDVALYYLPEHESFVSEYIDSAVGSLQTFSEWFGQYPHPRLTVVDVPNNASGAGGMEYPTLVTGGSAPGGFVSYVTSHEVGHQWWPMQTATNEGREPWLDEGLTEYSGARYMAEVNRNLGTGDASVSALSVSRSSYAGGTAVPATLPAWEYDSGEYGTVYFKTALGLWTLENIVGTERFHQAMREYLTTYRFKHPTGADFRASLEDSLDTDLSWLFDEYLPGTGVIDYAVGPIRNDSTGSTVTVERVGEVPAPVDVRVTLASGAQQTRQWDGSDSSEVYTFSASDPAVKVEVDPGQKLAAELNVVNNTATSQASLVPALTFAERLIFWLQSIVQSVGLFG